MNHNIESYPSVLELFNNIDSQLSGNLIAKMDTEFDKTLEEPDHKLRSKLVKAHKRNVKEVTPISSAISAHQIRMTQIKTNLTFVLESACYNLSYTAIAEDFAEYDFLSQTIKKECRKAQNNAIVKEFIEQSSVLNENYFDLLLETVDIMKTNVVAKMTREPDIYIDLNIEKDSDICFDDIKSAYKRHLKKLKKDLADQATTQGNT